MPATRTPDLAADLEAAAAPMGRSYEAMPLWQKLTITFEEWRVACSATPNKSACSAFTARRVGDPSSRSPIQRRRE